MKTPKKVIEKISLPLMFVTFVLAVLMFAVSPVSAAPPSQCGTDFCDQDGDGFIRDHKKCPLFCEGVKDLDDDVCTDPDNTGTLCDVVVSEGSITYTAELTGAFVFGLGPDAIVDVYPNSKDNVLWSDVHLYVYADPIYPDDATTWHNVFKLCPELLAPSLVSDFDVVADDWFISKHGGVRVMFRDFLLDYDHEGVFVEDGAVITVQLVGNYFDSDVENFLPVPLLIDDDEETSSFDLKKFVIWGNTAHEVPGKRRACQPPGDGGGGGETGDLTPTTPSTLTITATRHIP